MKIDQEFRSLIPPLASDELKQLETNLVNEGWRNNEAIITWNGTIIDGHNRYSICQKKGIKFKIVEKKFKDKQEAILWMIDNQLGRRNIPDYARVELNLRKEEIISPGKGFRTDLVPNGTRIDTKKEIAKLSKVGHNTVAKVKFIRDNADEETRTKLRSGSPNLSINKVYNDLKSKEKRKDIVKKIQEAPKIDGKKKYGIIYADPAWKYFESGNKNQSLHYNTMSIEDIKNLEVEKLAADDCVLFLWVTFPILKQALEVIGSWGFSYSTCGFNWVKRNKKADSWFFGLGSWTRANSELCLIATRGHPMRKSARVSQIIDTPIEGHSKKPDIVRDKIIELMGDLPRIELFARNKTKGWDSWGNEVKSDIELK